MLHCKYLSMTFVIFLTFCLYYKIMDTTLSNKPKKIFSLVFYYLVLSFVPGFTCGNPVEILGWLTFMIPFYSFGL